LAALVTCVHAVDIYINTYVGPDGKTYFTQPLNCNYSGSLLLSTYYNQLRSTYTVRDNRDCCYLADYRNQCCVQSDQMLYQQCRCSASISCGLPPPPPPTAAPTTAAPPPTTTPTTTTTTPTTTTTTTTTTPPTTTTTSTTTTTTPTTTTPTTTTPTTTTTTTTPTTTVPPSLCQKTISFRILNGVPVSDDCLFSGVSNITIPTGTTRRVSCNAVLTTATIDGVLKKTFLTTSICKSVITAALAGNLSVEISIGNQNYPIVAPIFNLTDGPNGVAYITVTDRYVNLLSTLGTCQTTACAYNESTMTGKIDFNSCKIVSWGSSDAGTLSQKGLFETAVAYSPLGCTTLPNLFGANTTMCFRTTSGKNLFCSGDSGAPTYCKSPSNNEWILMGVVALQTVCNSTPETKVVPFPR
ncbi:hypothetical protein Btru_059723, partial [Bulinus truncatus]